MATQKSKDRTLPPATPKWLARLRSGDEVVVLFRNQSPEEATFAKVVTVTPEVVVVGSLQFDRATGDRISGAVLSVSGRITKPPRWLRDLRSAETLRRFVANVDWATVPLRKLQRVLAVLKNRGRVTVTPPAPGKPRTI